MELILFIKNNTLRFVSYNSNKTYQNFDGFV